ncbi:hypothetical protein FRX31_025520, partial [Thalictrum thalictroides]
MVHEVKGVLWYWSGIWPGRKEFMFKDLIERQGYTGNPFTDEGCQGNGDTKAAVSSATVDTVQGSYVGYMVLLL